MDRAEVRRQGEAITRQIMELYASFEKHQMVDQQLQHLLKCTNGLLPHNADQTTSRMRTELRSVDASTSHEHLGTGIDDSFNDELTLSDEQNYGRAGSRCSLIDEISSINKGHSVNASDLSVESFDKVTESDESVGNKQRTPEMPYFHTTSSSIDSGYKSPSDYGSASCYNCEKNGDCPAPGEENTSVHCEQDMFQNQQELLDRLNDSGFYDCSLDLLMYLRASLNALQMRRMSTANADVVTLPTTDERRLSYAESTITASSTRTNSSGSQCRTVSTQTLGNDSTNGALDSQANEADVIPVFDEETNFEYKGRQQFYAVEGLETSCDDSAGSVCSDEKKKKKICKEPHSVHYSYDNSAEKSVKFKEPLVTREDFILSKKNELDYASKNDLQNENGAMKKKKQCTGSHNFGSLRCHSGHVTATPAANQKSLWSQNVSPGCIKMGGRMLQDKSKTKKSALKQKLTEATKPSNKLKSTTEIVRGVMDDMEKLYVTSGPATDKSTPSSRSAYGPAAAYHIYEEIPDHNHYQPKLVKASGETPPPLPDRPFRTPEKQVKTPTKVPEVQKVKQPSLEAVEKIKNLKSYISGLIDSRKKDNSGQSQQNHDSYGFCKNVQELGKCEVNFLKEPDDALCRRLFGEDDTKSRTCSTVSGYNNDICNVSDTYNLDVTGDILLSSPFKREMVRASLRVEKSRKDRREASKCRQNLYSLVNKAQYRQNIARHLEDEWNVLNKMDATTADLAPPIVKGVNSCQV